MSKIRVIKYPIKFIIWIVRGTPLLLPVSYTHLDLYKRHVCHHLVHTGINMRVGIGYDVHKLVEDRDLIIGGVKIPYEKGLLGHSDADVLLHAISDAILGAAALGDIGLHFPDTDERFKGADSLKLLNETGKLIKAEGYSLSLIHI